MSEIPSNFNFDADDLKPVEIPVQYGKKKYFLTEAGSGAVAKWRNAQIAGTRMMMQDDSDTKTVTLGGLGDTETLLVSLCLFSADENGRLRRTAFGDPDMHYAVPHATVKDWPNRVVSPLFETVKKISNLDDKDTEDVLEKRIKRDTAKLEALRRKKARGENTTEEELAKNVLPSTTDTSESAKS